MVVIDAATSCIEEQASTPNLYEWMSILLSKISRSLSITTFKNSIRKTAQDQINVEGLQIILSFKYSNIIGIFNLLFSYYLIYFLGLCKSFKVAVQNHTNFSYHKSFLLANPFSRLLEKFSL